MNRRTLVVLAAMAAVVAVAGGAFLLGRTSGEQTAPPVASSTSTPATGGVLSVTPGQGATDLAPDGVTPIGYPDTCVGAVAAAANIGPLFDVWGVVEGVEPERWRESVERVFVPGSKDGAELAQLAAAAATDPETERAARDDLAVFSHPEWGGFRLVSCTPGESAMVELLDCGVSIVEATSAYCDVGRYEMSWTGSPADWRFEDSPADEERQLPPTVKAIEERISAESDQLGPNGPSPAQRRAWLSELGSGWQEFANATR